MSLPSTFDLIIIGGGINGCGIAADAAGRGLRVLLAEMGDLAGGTSSASSKLIHGGLRYLEHYEFRLVREALAEREVLLAKAPHLIRPLRFVLPHGAGLRPRWMIRAGLFFYDNLYRRRAIPASSSLDLRRDPGGDPLKPEYASGFAYWDCWADDARLVVLNARAAADRGAEILTRWRMVSARQIGPEWQVRLESGNRVREVRARGLVNAAGPWLDRAGAAIALSDDRQHPGIRLVKGSHIVVPRIAGANDAYLLQNADGRVVFALPFEESFTIIGTTDVPYSGDPANVKIDGAEERYLLDLANQFFRKPLSQADIVWRYSGVRPLYDDHSSNPSALTRDYRLDLSGDDRHPPLLTVLGGKITTYRRLAEEALDRLRPFFPDMGPKWTANAALPGGDIPRGDFGAFLGGIQSRLPGIDAHMLKQLARRHGSLVTEVIGDARTTQDLGECIGESLTGREIVHFKAREWAVTADDILWRRTKAGVHLSPLERERALERIDRILRD